MKRNSSLPEKIIQLLRNKLTIYTWLKINFVYLAIFIGLILLNYLISLRIYGGQEFFINWASARLLFIQGINPYSKDAITLLSSLAKDLNILPIEGNFQFVSPLYSLFIYLPFGIINNFELSRGLWMTLMELSAFISGYLLLLIFNWKPEKLIKIVFTAFSILFFFMVLNIIGGSNLVFLNLFFILGLKWIFEEKFISAGIIIAVLTINLQIFLIPLFLIFIYAISRKAWNFFLWFIITVFLSSLLASLIITDWPLLFFRELVRNSFIANARFPGEMVNQWVEKTNPWIWNGLALILSALLFYELLIFKNNKDGFLWVICLAIVLNPLIWMRSDLNGFVSLLLPFGLIFSQWIHRDKKIGSILVVLFSVVFSLGLIILSILTQSILFIKPYPFFLYLFPIIILFINLYWIRWWMDSSLPTRY